MKWNNANDQISDDWLINDIDWHYFIELGAQRSMLQYIDWSAIDFGNWAAICILVRSLLKDMALIDLSITCLRIELTWCASSLSIAATESEFSLERYDPICSANESNPDTILQFKLIKIKINEMNINSIEFDFKSPESNHNQKYINLIQSYLNWCDNDQFEIQLNSIEFHFKSRESNSRVCKSSNQIIIQSN